MILPGNEEGYIIAADENLLVEEEDVPPEIYLSLSGIKYLTEINIQPFAPNDVFIEKVVRAARKMARENTGILENPQSGEIYYPPSCKKTVSVSRVEAESLISVVWYIDTDCSMNEKYPQLVDLFEKYLPNAVPRRYGSYEPPQFIYKDTGKEHFVKFLQTEDFPVCYTTKPIEGLYLSDPSKSRKPKEYRCNRVQLTIYKSYYDLPNWNFAVKRLFKKVAILLRPFYAEIHLSEESQICSWWWRGLPQKMGYTIIVGEPYVQLWKKIRCQAECIADNLLYIDNGNLPVNKKVGTPPRRLISKRKLSAIRKRDNFCFKDNYRYAGKFPFEV
jgi:hypothetical protein